ncbi:transglycosylase SLT domain-containing protein [Endothiovibrio diazotrophicus]
MRRALAALFPAALLAVAAALPVWAAGDLEPVDSPRWSRDFDAYFRKYSKRYFGPHFDWRWFKAQAITESHLNPEARSAAGARGLMQLMPATFEEIQREKPHFVDLDAPRWNVAAGIYYDGLLFRKWRGLPEQERLYLALASYNAGYGRVRSAYRQAPAPVSGWREVSHRVPGQTRAYVARIQDVMEVRSRKRLRGVEKFFN